MVRHDPAHRNLVGYTPGVDDPLLDPELCSGTQLTQILHVPSRLASEGEGFDCPPGCSEARISSTGFTDLRQWGEPGVRVAALLAELRRTDGRHPGWRVPFELARVLRSFPDQGSGEFEELACAFFRALGRDPSEGWFSFLHCWRLVRCPAGQDSWDVAVEAARARPLAMSPDPGIRLAPLASVAAYLAIATPGEPFVFPVPRIVVSFGWPRSTAGRAVAALVAVGVIAWADPTWSYAEGRARTARFIATLNDPAWRPNG